MNISIRNASKLTHKSSGVGCWNNMEIHRSTLEDHIEVYSETGSQRVWHIRSSLRQSCSRNATEDNNAGYKRQSVEPTQQMTHQYE